MTITCPQCHHANPDDAEFCENCGAQLPVAAAVAAPGVGMAMPAAGSPVAAPASAANQLVCPNCQAPLAEGDEFCFNCGTDVRNVTTASAAAPQPASLNGGAPVALPATQPDPNAMSDDAINRALADMDNPGGAVAAPTPTVNQVGPEAQPVANPPQQPPTPIVANNSAGSIPVPPGPAGGVAANAFGMPPTPTANGAAPASRGTGPLPRPASPAGSLRLHISGPYGEEVVEWQGREILLGRNDPKTRVFPEVNLDDSAASRRHLAVWKEVNDGLYYAQDLESANGTSLNGRDLRPGEPTEIHNGDTLKIGTRYNIRVEIG